MGRARNFPREVAVVSYLILSNARARVVDLASSVSYRQYRILNFGWKISAHAAGIGGLVAYCYIFTSRFGMEYTFIFIAAVLLAGLVMASRIRLDAHSPAQTYIGFLIGIGITLFAGPFLEI